MDKLMALLGYLIVFCGIIVGGLLLSEKNEIKHRIDAAHQIQRGAQ